jgi:hypothetical protein
MLSQINLDLGMQVLRLLGAKRFKAVLVKKRGPILTTSMQSEMFLRMSLSLCQLHRGVESFSPTEFMTESLERNLKRK